MTQGVMGAPDAAPEVDLQDALEVRQVRQVRKIRDHAHARVVDEHVESPEFVDGSADQVAAGGGIGDVGGHGEGRGAATAAVRGDRLEILGAAGGQHELRTRVGQLPRHLAPDTARGAGDHDNVIAERAVSHVRLAPLRCRRRTGYFFSGSVGSGSEYMGR